MKNNLISILVCLISGITFIHAQERSVEGFLKQGNESVVRVKLFENEQKEMVLVIADSNKILDLDSIIQTNNYNEFTINDSVRKLNDTIQQVLILQNGELKVLDVELGIKVKKYTESFSLKIENTIDTEGLVNANTLEISFKYWCMESNTYSDTKEQCESACTGECYKRSF